MKLSWFAVFGAFLSNQAWLAQASITLDVLGTYKTFAEGGAEIVDYDPCTQLMYITNSAEGRIDVVDITDPESPTKLDYLEIPAGYAVTSVSVAPEAGIIAASAANDGVSTDPGIVVFYTYDIKDYIISFTRLGSIQVGALPDMLTFTPDYESLLVANEGEPDDNNDLTSTDPDGSVSIIDMSAGAQAVIDYPGTYVKTVTFDKYIGEEDALRLAGIRITSTGGVNKTAPQDFEPEYIAITPDSKYAFVTLQENNAVAKIDIANAMVLGLFPLGFQDHSKVPMDMSDRDGISLLEDGRGVSFRTIPNLFGMRMPDTIATYEAADGDIYFVTANEGDARDWDGDARLKDDEIVLDDTVFPEGDKIKEDQVAGRLEVSAIDGDTDGDGDLDKIFSYGSRSFSIFDAMGKLIFDSGSDFEVYTFRDFPADFNSDNDENDSFDSRSDAKGPEPEALAVGEVDGRIYAFIGLERMGGVMIYDVTEPGESFFVDYVNNRNFAVEVDIAAGTAGDLGPEGIKFVPADQSPIKNAILLVANEISGSTTVYEIVSTPGGKGKGGKGKGSKKSKRRDLKVKQVQEEEDEAETRLTRERRTFAERGLKGKGKKGGSLSCRRFR
eukprot:scaffold8271_cov171-Amphora_coffeaeformis.AAC.10